MWSTHVLITFFGFYRFVRADFLFLPPPSRDRCGICGVPNWNSLLFNYMQLFLDSRAVHCFIVSFSVQLLKRFLCVPNGARSRTRPAFCKHSTYCSRAFVHLCWKLYLELACDFYTILLFAFIWRREKKHTSEKQLARCMVTHAHTRLKHANYSKWISDFHSVDNARNERMSTRKRIPLREKGAAHDSHCFGKWGDIVWPGQCWISLFVMFDRCELLQAPIFVRAISCGNAWLSGLTQ